MGQYNYWEIKAQCANYLLFQESENDVISHYNNYDIPLTIH
jgi:hypothetical protein